MRDIYEVFIVPVLSGLLILSVLIQAMIFWQMERSWRVFSFIVVFVSLTLLYLVAALHLPLFWREVGRIGFIVGLAASVFFRGKEVLAFMQAKARKKNQANTSKSIEPSTRTLQELSVGSVPVKLDATEVVAESEKEQN